VRPALPGGPYLVVGLARSGRAAALALRARGESVIGLDQVLTPAVAQLRGAGVEIAAGDGVELLDRVGCVVKSPGVPREALVVEAALARGICVIGELELAWRLLEQPFIAVTGTNGKTTTVELIGAMYRAGGAAVAVAGNVGRPLSALACAAPFGEGPLEDATTIVCEASSFQLEDTIEFAPEAAVLLNVSADHLDRHHTMDAYVAAKLRVFACQDAGGVAVLGEHDAELVHADAARRVLFGGSERCAMRVARGALWWEGERLIEVDELRLRGAHNLENAMAAAAVALAGGLAADAVVAALRSFAGGAHRLEDVATLDGVLYVNDSKATNVASTLVALRAFAPGSLHVILGGQGKAQDFKPLRGEVAKRAAHCYLIGEDAAAIGAALGEPAALSECGTLERALAAAAERARPGETVLLSPACASFDQFRDFEERGDVFRALVRERAGGA
jgi:UDP-N-acetylmuramoylalanine--D-glutamate ligase